jgi:ABC-type multidrug transport system fused ATPase/permease subunit
MMFESGRIVEQGTFDELLALDGKFAALVATQLSLVAKAA